MGRVLFFLSLSFHTHIFLLFSPIRRLKYEYIADVIHIFNYFGSCSSIFYPKLFVSSSRIIYSLVVGIFNKAFVLMHIQLRLGEDFSCRLESCWAVDIIRPNPCLLSRILILLMLCLNGPT